MFKYLIFLVLIMSCDSVQQTDSSMQSDKEAEDSSGIALAAASLQGCYVARSEVDSAILKMDVNGNKVTGELSYDYFEKDKNRGMFEGVIIDSFIIADYTFQSEGVVSVREVVFKIQGHTLFEGFGDISMFGDTARFKNKAGLNYQLDHPFVKTICK